jgi:hypothetical protein
MKEMTIPMNIHINKTTRLQPWDGKTVFGEYPVFIRPGNFTVTLLFHDKESINRFCQLLMDTIFEIDSELGQPGRCPVQLKLRKSK